MPQVYQHAMCNIAASHSAKSFGGLFKNRRHASLGSGALDVDKDTLKGQFYLIDEAYFSQEIDDTPLNRRCWVVSSSGDPRLLLEARITIIVNLFTMRVNDHN